MPKYTPEQIANAIETVLNEAIDSLDNWADNTNDEEEKLACQEKRGQVSMVYELLKATPDLLEALKLSWKYVAKMVADDVQTAIPPQVALDKIEAAIAKAESHL